MKQVNKHHALENRLRRRAAELASTPLLGPEVANALRMRLGREAAREGFALVRKRAVFTSLGLLAAALMMIFAPAPRPAGPMNFGLGQASVALLDAGGRSLGAGLRSGEKIQGASASSFLLELVADETVHVAVRLRVDGVWQNPLAEDSLRLLAGEDLLRSVQWPAGELRLLVFLSERPIPGELLKRRLASSDGTDLQRQFGCRVIERDLSRTP